MKTGTANLPLHYGAAPRWLFTRMARLAREIAIIMVDRMYAIRACANYLAAYPSDLIYRMYAIRACRMSAKVDNTTVTNRSLSCARLLPGPRSASEIAWTLSNA